MWRSAVVVVLRVAVALTFALAVAACHRTTHHEANVEITRISTVRKDPAGKALTTDVELSFTECPGTQIEVIRGGAEFAECIAKRKVGDKVKVAIEHAWTSEGTYHWTVQRLDDCVRQPDPADEASFAMVRECEDWSVNGTRVGFQCRYVPERRLLDACPWFRRR